MITEEKISISLEVKTVLEKNDLEKRIKDTSWGI